MFVGRLSYGANVINTRPLASIACALAGTVTVLAGCAPKGGPHAAAEASPSLARVVFREPTSPADAASEFVRAMANRQTAVEDRLTCRSRPSYGSWPLITTTSGSRPHLHFAVTAVRQTQPKAWSVVVRARFGDSSKGFRVFTTVVKEADQYPATVVKQADRYRVCTAESR